MQIIDSFELSAKKPLDARQMWDSLADLEANVATLMPVGFLAYCKAEGEWYQLKSAADESDPTTYVWQLQQSSSVAIQVKSLPVIKEGEEDKITEWASNTFYQLAPQYKGKKDFANDLRMLAKGFYAMMQRLKLAAVPEQPQEKAATASVKTIFNY